MKEWLQSEISELNRQTYQNFFNQWNWEWFCTVRLNARKEASVILREFCTMLMRQEGGQIGYMGIFVNGESGPHLHVLLLGRFPKGKTLKNIDEFLWTMNLIKIAGKSCEISKVDEKHNRVNYILKTKNTPAGRHELLVPWGRILKKTKLTA